MSNFKTDLKAEAVLANFLDSNFYSNAKSNEIIRETDSSKQYQGIDVSVSYKGNEYLIDEKGYLSKPTIQNTFALELSHLKNGLRIEGWFNKKSKLTTHYLLCWADREDVLLKDLKEDDIERVKAIFIDKERLIEYMNTKAWFNKKALKDYETRLIKGTNSYIKLEDGIKIQISKQLYEQPINLIVTYDIYIESGSVLGKYMIDKEGYTYL